MLDPEPSDENAVIRVARLGICTTGRNAQMRFWCSWKAIGEAVRKLDDQHLECVVVHWSRAQVSVALSSAEAELNASVTAACEALGMKEMCDYLGIPVVIKMFGDSSARREDVVSKMVRKDETLRGTTASATGTHSLWKRVSSQGLLEQSGWNEEEGVKPDAQNNKRTCCMRELVEECPRLGCDTHAVGRPKRAVERRQAKTIAGPRSSRCQGVDNDAKDPSNELHPKLQADSVLMLRNRISKFGRCSSCGDVPDQDFCVCRLSLLF